MLSLVIPTLNSERSLARNLAAIDQAAPAGLIRQIIVSDGSSEDRTPAIATAAGAQVVAETRGRGGQLAVGANYAEGSWLLFLHADTELDAAAWAALRHYISDTNNGGRAAYFRFTFRETGFRPWIWRWAVALRCRVFALPYGDQGLLIQRDLYQRIGGYRSLPLMEDVDLVRRLGRSRLTCLSGFARTSARRFEARGYLRQAWLNFRLVQAFYRGADPVSLHRRYVGPPKS